MTWPLTVLILGLGVLALLAVAGIMGGRDKADAAKLEKLNVILEDCCLAAGVNGKVYDADSLDQAATRARLLLAKLRRTNDERAR